MPAAIHRKLSNSYGSTSISIKNVRKWHREFSNERTNVHDEARNGRSSVSDDVQEQVESELGYQKCSARWVPKMRTEDHKRQRIESFRQVLDLYAEKGGSLCCTCLAAAAEAESVARP
ncbi:hypothetical protein QTP88_018192 [Uroleucon formosanum]